MGALCCCCQQGDPAADAGVVGGGQGMSPAPASSSYNDSYGATSADIGFHGANPGADQYWGDDNWGAGGVVVESMTSTKARGEHHFVKV
mmetsp:Transcript_8084/g.19559  ORF Transcript_8084/g.19559 Transcript_8084/m.19559 type:complete len:89 (+) Transcript_8084:66-332(+)|eukprot:g14143.t1